MSVSLANPVNPLWVENASWQGWLPMIFASIVIGYLIVAISYMIASFMRSSEFEAWAKNEMSEVTLSALYVANILMFVGFANILLGSEMIGGAFHVSVPASCAGQNYLCIANYYLDTLGTDLIRIFGTNLEVMFPLSMVSSISLDFCVIVIPTGVVNIGICAGEMFFGGFGMVSMAVSSATNMITLGLFSVFMQKILLQFFSTTMFKYFLPIGVFLRTFSLTRKMGATLMAVAIGLYVVYPLALIMNYQIYSAVPKFAVPAASSNIGMTLQAGSWMSVFGGPDFSSCGGWNIFCWLKVIIQWAAALVGAFASLLAFTVSTLVQLIAYGGPGKAAADTFEYYADMIPHAMQPMVAALFLPALDLLLVVTAIRAISPAIGGETNITGLAQLI
ncbi:MAG: hypothetical protein ABIH99_03540 [Candidatus Micrarchaeota archaeon]